jgi:alkanesulfonate monooxygenase SsuD/methylene tetrahydromethanopterin reductase-like flavin-dependent oxidoreductase (luciferase family)
MMHLAAFMNAGPQGTAGWRHPDAAPDFLRARYYTDIAQMLEAAMFDMVFIPDALAMPRSLGGTFDPAVRWGSGTPRLDPMPLPSPPDIPSPITSRVPSRASIN